MTALLKLHCLKSANSRSALGQCKLGSCFGKGIGMNKDYKKALDGI